MNPGKTAAVVRRLAVCLIGAFIYASGVCVLTRAALGISPISSFPYVMSSVTTLSLGTCTMGLNLILIAIQKLALGRKFTLRICLMQFALSLVFSVFIDLNIALFGSFRPSSYPGKLAYLLFGCAVLAVGMALVVMADFVLIPGEGAARCIQTWIGKEFGTAKIVFDCSMVVCAVVTSLIFLRRVEGVREGTVIAAVLIGTFARVFMRHVKGPLSRFLGTGQSDTVNESAQAQELEAVQ